MNLALSEEQRLLQDAVDKFFRQESTPARVRAAEPSGDDLALWAGVVDMGLPLMRVPAARGGGEQSLLDAVLVAELAGRHLASAPIVESIVAAALLAQLEGDAAADWLARIERGEARVTLALRAVEAEARQLVPGGAVADGVVCLHDDALYVAASTGKPPLAAGHALPLAPWKLDGPRVLLARGASVVAAYRAAVEEWKLLTAAAAGGLARAALDQAAAYCRERQAFGRPIGSFQGLAHPLADSVTDVDGGRLAIWQAVSAIAARRPDAAAQVSLACWWMTQAAPRATIRAMRAFGGYGMTMDYDAQLYFRRVRALSLLGGDPRHELGRAADRLFGDAATTSLPEAGDIGIDFAYGAAAEQAATDARAFFETHLTDELRAFARESLDGHHPAFLKQLAAAGLLFPDWPREFGGPARGGFESVAIRGVIAQYDWMFALIPATDIIAKTVMMFASPEIKRAVLPKIAAGEAFCAMGYTEPSCGSDVFAAQTRAVRDGDAWVIDGQKMFTSQGHLASHVLVLARTNADVPKHAGLTLFLVPTSAPGYECHEVKTVSDERTNITYYSGVRVPDSLRVGEVDGGVKVLAAALTMEQGGNAYFVHAMQQLYAHAVAWARKRGGHVTAPIDDPDVRRRLARLAAHVAVTGALTDRAIWTQDAGCAQKSHGPMAKLFGTEAWIACTTDLMELTAPGALLHGDPDLERIELDHRRAIPASVYGGTSEILRSMVAEDALGLPRTRS
jgi:3-oxochol-4-en-24-oyl-CoA dehydrogenase